MNNVFKFGSEKNVFKKIKLFFRRLKWARERTKKGYCGWDVGDIDVWFLSTVPEMLKEYRDSFTRGLPQVFIGEYYAEHKEEYTLTLEELSVNSYDDERKDECERFFDNAYKAWTDTVNEMITLFEECASPETKDEKKEQCKDRAFKLFSKYFYNFWV